MSGESNEYEIEVCETVSESINYTEQMVEISDKLIELNNTVIFISWFVILIFIFNCILHKRGIF